MKSHGDGQMNTVLECDLMVYFSSMYSISNAGKKHQQKDA